jgi:osmotically inducible lipoprotein OsmB
MSLKLMRLAVQHKRCQMKTILAALAAILMGLTGCASIDRQTAGTVGGAVVGGVVGDAVVGNKAGTIGGAAAGAYIGNRATAPENRNRNRY